jgi:OmpA-OmpF porin, OOP family
MRIGRVPLILAGTLLAVATHARIINVPSEFKSIGEALSNADSGDSIKVAHGVYNENITLVQGVVVKGANPINTIIDGGRRGAVVNGVADGTITGFTIRNGIEGFLCENAPASISNSYIIDNHATGIAAFISLPVIANNVIYGNRWSGVLAWGTKSFAARIEQNVIMRNGYSGLSLMGPTYIVVRNNIIMENHRYGIFAEDAAGQTKIEYNDIYKNYYQFSSGVKVPRSNINTEPMFRNASLATPDFRVAAKSPLARRGKGRKDIGLIDASKIGGRDGDKDKDGILDSEDNCPDEAEDMDMFEDEDGCPEVDNDKDGVLDGQDQCSDEKEDLDGFKDGDGCPDTDNDNDGIADADDLCPNDAETINKIMDEDGCPDIKPKKPGKVTLYTLQPGVGFSTGTTRFSDGMEKQLVEILVLMNSYPKLKFQIRSYTGEYGPKRKLKNLTKDRAKLIKKWLVGKGVKSNRLTYVGNGGAKPRTFKGKVKRNMNWIELRRR